MIEKGVLVVLKSGGPVMTVKRDDDLADGVWVCSWFVGSEEKEATFEEEQLLLVKVENLDKQSPN